MKHLYIIQFTFNDPQYNFYGQSKICYQIDTNPSSALTKCALIAYWEMGVNHCNLNKTLVRDVRINSVPCNDICNVLNSIHAGKL